MLINLEMFTSDEPLPVLLNAAPYGQETALVTTSPCLRLTRAYNPFINTLKLAYVAQYGVYLNHICWIAWIVDYCICQFLIRHCHRRIFVFCLGWQAVAWDFMVTNEGTVGTVFQCLANSSS